MKLSGNILAMVQHIHSFNNEQKRDQAHLEIYTDGRAPLPLPSKRPFQKTAPSRGSTIGGGSPKYKFKNIASEGTNIVYKTTPYFGEDVYKDTAWAGYQGPLVFKMPKEDSDELFKKLSDPRNAVAKYNTIHAGHQHPPAVLYQSSKGLGWMSPYFPSSRQATDDEIALEIVEQYKKTGRITYDAATDGNYLLVNLNCNGHEVCTSPHPERDDAGVSPSSYQVELVDVDVLVRHNKNPTALRETPSRLSPALGETVAPSAELNPLPGRSSPRSLSSRPSTAESLTTLEIDNLDDLYRETYWQNKTLNLLRPKTMEINQNLIYLDKQYKVTPELSDVFPRAELSYVLIKLLTPLRQNNHPLNKEMLESIKGMLPALESMDEGTQVAIIDGLILAEQLPPQRSGPTPPSIDKTFVEPHRPLSARPDRKLTPRGRISSFKEILESRQETELSETRRRLFISEELDSKPSARLSQSPYGLFQPSAVKPDDDKVVIKDMEEEERADTGIDDDRADGDKVVREGMDVDGQAGDGFDADGSKEDLKSTQSAFSIHSPKR